MVLVLLLVGWASGKVCQSITELERNDTKLKQDYFGHWIENNSITKRSNIIGMIIKDKIINHCRQLNFTTSHAFPSACFPGLCVPLDWAELVGNLGRNQFTGARRMGILVPTAPSTSCVQTAKRCEGFGKTRLKDVWQTGFSPCSNSHSMELARSLQKPIIHDRWLFDCFPANFDFANLLLTCGGERWAHFKVRLEDKIFWLWLGDPFSEDCPHDKTNLTWKRRAWKKKKKLTAGQHTEPTFRKYVMFGWGIICKVQELSSLSKVLENYAPKLLFKQWFQCEKNRKKNNENSNHNTFKQTGLYFQTSLKHIYYRYVYIYRCKS